MSLSNRPGLSSVPSGALGAGAITQGARRVSVRARREAWAIPVCLALLVLAQYAHAVRFGLIWDDPAWFAQGAGRSAWEIVTALATYQFYRPLAILLNRSLVSPAGVVNVAAAHLIQIGAHLGCTLLAVPALRALGLTRRHAGLTALVFALLPFAYQAVAWQSPQQPLAMLGVLAALACAARADSGRPAAWLALSAVAYAVALLVQESALPFVFAFVWLAACKRPAGRRVAWWWPAVHLALAGLYALVWLGMPRLAGVTGAGFQLSVLGYVLQALVFPAAALAALAPGAAQWPLLGLVAVGAALAAGLVGLAWRASSLRAAALCLAWAGAGLLPIWAGLSWDYVQVGERLVYPAALGIAGLWSAPMLWVLRRQTPAWQQAVGGLALAGVFGLSLWQTWQLRQLYTLGTGHLEAAVAVFDAHPGERLLFVNFPDRLALRPAPYPLGFWGLVLAPIGQDLAGFAEAATAQSAEDRSVSAFQVGAAERAAWAYRVDMRGSDTPPEALWDHAAWASEVYLTEYRAPGSLNLRPVGAVVPVPYPPEAVATLEGGVALLRAQVMAGATPRLELLWHSRAPQALDTSIFVHFWQAGQYVAGADGDSLGGLLPVYAWRPDGAVRDVRTLPDLPPGEYAVTVGLYHRWSGQRLGAWAPDGRRLPEDEIFVASVTVP